ncbi:MAG: hypothetical protein AAFY60_15630, partial [Myxococcota bacterium]
MKIQRVFGIAAVVAFGLVGCSGGDKPADGGDTPAADGKAGGDAPAEAKPEEKKPAGPFTLAWSEYPSWSAFDVAGSKGYLNGKE